MYQTHYKLGLIQGLEFQFSKAAESLNCALQIIKTRIESSIDTDDKIVLKAKVSTIIESYQDCVEK